MKGHPAGVFRQDGGSVDASSIGFIYVRQQEKPMKIRTCALMAAILPVVGCQTTGEMTEVDRQAVLLAAVPSNYRQVVPLSFRAIVPDPSGIQTSEISTPIMGSLNARTDFPLVCVRVQYGDGSEDRGGAQTIAFGFQDGSVVDSQRNSPTCATATYSLFPELRSAYPTFGSPAI